MADGCEAGYVWDEHFVSVGSKQIRKPKKDGWFEHGQNCMEYLEINFGAGRETRSARDERERQERARVEEPYRVESPWG
jgi:hypothetical protein